MASDSEGASVPAGPFAHVSILVKDLRQAVENWTKILEVFDPDQVREPIVYQHWESGDDVMDVATFVNPNGCEIQLVQPLNDDGPVGRRLARHGEGVHHLCFVQKDLEAKVAELAGKGIELTGMELARDPEMPWQAWTFVAPRSSGGVFVELAYPYAPVDGKWTPGAGVAAESAAD
jgi:methylmalonyl-CoA/ethylmalonyl-CoA epimerase